MSSQKKTMMKTHSYHVIAKKLTVIKMTGTFDTTLTRKVHFVISFQFMYNPRPLLQMKIKNISSFIAVQIKLSWLYTPVSCDILRKLTCVM